jgi:hypothetical protein
MARVDHGLGSAMPYPSLPCGRVTPETALRLFPAWPAHRVGGLQPSSTPLDTPRRTPMSDTTDLPHTICHKRTSNGGMVSLAFFANFVKKSPFPWRRLREAS